MAFNPAFEGMGVGGWLGVGGVNVTFKRKFRWTLEIRGKQGGCDFYVPPHFVQIAARPQVTFEEVEINFLNRRTWWPGKPTWEPITVTYFDAVGNHGQQTPHQLIRWLSAMYTIGKDRMSSRRNYYLGEAELFLLNGCGQKMERWLFLDAWPQAVNWGDVDYSSSDIATIELTLRYSDVRYWPGCGRALNLCGCGSCGGGTGFGSDGEDGYEKAVGGGKTIYPAGSTMPVVPGGPFGSYPSTGDTGGEGSFTRRQ